METSLLVLFAVFAVVYGLSLSSRFTELKLNQAKIDHKLNLLLQHHGIEVPAPAAAGYVPPDLLPQIRDLIQTRKKVHAIKLLRERTGHSLLDAKNTIEGLERSL